MKNAFFHWRIYNLIIHNFVYAQKSKQIPLLFFSLLTPNFVISRQITVLIIVVQYIFPEFDGVLNK